MPSSGGGTKLMRTFLAGVTEGVCSGAGEGVTDSAGEIDKAGDSSGTADGVGVGNSCAKMAGAKNAISIAVFIFVGIERRYLLLANKRAEKNSERFLDFAGNDKWPRCSNASSRSEKDYRAIRSHAEILYQHCLQPTDRAAG